MEKKRGGWRDGVELCAKAEDASGKTAAHRYVLDKIVHNLPIRQSILDRDDTSLIIMVRDPLQTIRSILEIKAGGIDDLEGACDYYAARLVALRELIGPRRSGGRHAGHSKCWPAWQRRHWSGHQARV